MPLHIETPLLESAPLSRLAGREIRLKLEALQPSGSFKLRGIGLACETFAQQGKRRFISSSGGNAGIAVAYAGQRLGVPVTVVVPETTTERARTLIHELGAELLVHGASWAEANAKAQSLLDGSSAFLHPFDHPLLWRGHASLVDEVARSGFKPDALVLSVGGGGLLSGVIEGLDRNGWGDLPVIAVENPWRRIAQPGAARRQAGESRRHHQHRHLAGRQAGVRARLRSQPQSQCAQRRHLRPAPR